MLPMKILKWVILTLAVLFVLIQVVRPDRTNPPVDPTHTIQSSLQIPPAVNAILERSCNDCHSNNTVWPWYSNVAPLSWWLVDHVNEGRSKLSFSEWKGMSARKAAHKLEEMCEQVEKGEMPLSSYLPLHPDAKLSDADKKTLCDWTKTEGARLEAMGQTAP
jgi:cytochrome c551/c552